MNYHFTTTRAHIELQGASILELCGDEGLNTQSTNPFKGNMDLDKVEEAISRYTPEKVSFIRMEATTNLFGGQPFSLQNLRDVKAVAVKYNILLVFDGSLISENAYFIQMREPGCADKSVQEIITEMMSLPDVLYMSGRKSTNVRGGMIATNSKKHYTAMLEWLPVYEGFATYGGMSTKEIEAMAVGMREMTDTNTAGCAAEMVKYLAERLIDYGVPVVTPPGGPRRREPVRAAPAQTEYPAGALAAAVYLASGARGMERGTMSYARDKDGSEIPADLELVRLAVPRRAYTMGQMEYVADRVDWLYQHRDMIGGL